MFKEKILLWLLAMRFRLKNILDNLPNLDKLKHFYIGCQIDTFSFTFAMLIVLWLKVNPLYSLLGIIPVLILAALNEIIDCVDPKRMPEILDFFYSIYPAIQKMFLIIIFHLLILHYYGLHN